MGKNIIVDPELLYEVSGKIIRSKKCVEDVVDTIPYIKRMAWDVWGSDNAEKDIFEEHCQNHRKETIELMVHIEQRAKALRDASGIYDSVNANIKSKIEQLPLMDLF